MKHNYANIKSPTIIRRALRLNELLIFKAVHHILQFLRNRKPHPCCVLDDRDSLIRDVEEDYGRAQDTSAADDVDIEDIRHADKGEDADLLADSLEADGTGQFLFHNRTENASDVVHCDKHNERIEQIVEATKKLPNYDANARRIQTYGKNMIHAKHLLLSSIFRDDSSYVDGSYSIHAEAL